ncbi:MAG: glycosyltransferase, partial [Spirochaetia bacterium]|nr:glycosyltransferase [Spirochaetia bacterium]
MNIVVLHYHRIGGSGIVAYEIGRAMAEERGHKVHFMGLEPPFRLGDNYTEQMRFHKVWVKEYAVFDHQPYALALASQLVDIIRDHDIDVIHSHYALPHAVAAILAREMALDMLGKKVRCVTTLHGTDITVVGSHPSMKNITRHAIEKSDAVVAVSDYLKHETVRHFGTAPEKITTIYNFINPQFFNPGYRSESHCPRKKGCRTIVHISNLREVKDPFAVIRIFHGMIQEMPKLELFIVGEG